MEENKINEEKLLKLRDDLHILISEYIIMPVIFLKNCFDYSIMLASFNM